MKLKSLLQKIWPKEYVKKFVFCALVIIFISGCVSPFVARYKELDNAYSSGKITYAEYLQLKQNLQFQEEKQMDNAIQYLGQSMQSTADSMQRSLQYQSESISRNRPISTHCSTIGNRTYCTSY